MTRLSTWQTASGRDCTIREDDFARERCFAMRGSGNAQARTYGREMDKHFRAFRPLGEFSHRLGQKQTFRGLAPTEPTGHLRMGRRIFELLGMTTVLAIIAAAGLLFWLRPWHPTTVWGWLRFVVLALPVTAAGEWIGDAVPWQPFRPTDWPQYVTRSNFMRPSRVRCCRATPDDDRHFGRARTRRNRDSDVSRQRRPVGSLRRWSVRPRKPPGGGTGFRSLSQPPEPFRPPEKVRIMYILLNRRHRRLAHNPLAVL